MHTNSIIYVFIGNNKRFQLSCKALDSYLTMSYW